MWHLKILSYGSFNEVPLSSSKKCSIFFPVYRFLRVLHANLSVRDINVIKIGQW